MNASSKELEGLSAHLDKLCHHHGGLSLPADKPHAFVYFITITNRSDRKIKLLGRKWILHHCDGSYMVVEGDGIVGESPSLAPGEQFSYNSYHVTGIDAAVYGSFHGVDEHGARVHVLLPRFDLRVPQAKAS